MMLASRGAVWTAAVVLVAAAVTGGYLGYSRAASAPGSAADTDAYDVTPLAAKQASPLGGAAAPPPIDEDYIRKIAHDEAETILHPPQAPKKVAVAKASDDSDDSDDDDKSPGANPPTPPASPAAAAAAAAPKPPPPPPTGLY